MSRIPDLPDQPRRCHTELRPRVIHEGLHVRHVLHGIQQVKGIGRVDGNPVIPIRQSHLKEFRCARNPANFSSTGTLSVRVASASADLERTQASWCDMATRSTPRTYAGGDRARHRLLEQIFAIRIASLPEHRLGSQSS
jgi:hypothetical protein